MTHYHHVLDCFPTTALIAVEGEVDTSTCLDFQRRLRTLSDQGCRRIVLDLEKVDFMSGQAAATVHEMHLELSRVGGGLTVAAASRQVRRLFDAAGLSRMLPSDCQPTPASPVEPRGLEALPLR